MRRLVQLLGCLGILAGLLFALPPAPAAGAIADEVSEISHRAAAAVESYRGLDFDNLGGDKIALETATTQTALENYAAQLASLAGRESDAVPSGMISDLSSLAGALAECVKQSGAARLGGDRAGAAVAAAEMDTDLAQLVSATSQFEQYAALNPSSSRGAMWYFWTALFVFSCLSLVAAVALFIHSGSAAEEFEPLAAARRNLVISAAALTVGAGVPALQYWNVEPGGTVQVFIYPLALGGFCIVVALPRYFSAARRAKQAGRMAPRSGLGAQLPAGAGLAGRVPDGLGGRVVAGPGLGPQVPAAPGFGAQPPAAPGFGAQPSAAPGFGAQPPAGPGFAGAVAAGAAFNSQGAPVPGYGAQPGPVPAYGAAAAAGSSPQVPPDPGYGGQVPTGAGYGAQPGPVPGYGAGVAPGYGVQPGVGPGYGAQPGPVPGYGAQPGPVPGYGAQPGVAPGYGAAAAGGPGYFEPGPGEGGWPGVPPPGPPLDQPMPRQGSAPGVRAAGRGAQTGYLAAPVPYPSPPPPAGQAANPNWPAGPLAGRPGTGGLGPRLSPAGRAAQRGAGP
ncbi:MAG: hypothetical protein LBD51_00125 [Bifidobacteriaceae bacterium]|jgi:hypothetical protein|nr:hypothetical protein [Bifidobacteriaceae bacterium]